jgi:hypothetical protein
LENASNEAFNAMLRRNGMEGTREDGVEGRG